MENPRYLGLSDWHRAEMLYVLGTALREGYDFELMARKAEEENLILPWKIRDLRAFYEELYRLALSRWA